MSLLDNTLKVSDMDPVGYDAIYMGGHDVMFDFPKSASLKVSASCATLFLFGFV
jgi:hypothetical protein